MLSIARGGRKGLPPLNCWSVDGAARVRSHYYWILAFAGTKIRIWPRVRVFVLWQWL